jgi:F-type H+-transporting ATPase subunit b
MINMLSIVAATEAVEETSEGIGALGLDPIALLAQAATFLLLLWVVKKYALDGIVKNLDKRHNDIDRGLHLTAEMDKQKAELEATVEKAMANARKESDVIIAEARTESGRVIQAAEESANRRAEEIMKAAEGKIANDISSARQELKEEMANLITDATEAILNQKLDAKEDLKLIEDYLKEAMK